MVTDVLESEWITTILIEGGRRVLERRKKRVGYRSSTDAQ